MVAEVQYGGKITDDLDRRMFKTYTQVCAEYFDLVVF
jgi:Dynein heavy chain AAA lid domain